MNSDEKLAKIREFVKLQAEDEILWALPLQGKQTIKEDYLQRALRKIHMVIGSGNQELIDQMIYVYKKQLEEMEE
jgi:hypothetical protein